MLPANILKVDLYGEQIAPRHSTDKYELLKTDKSSAVYRRGSTFYISILLDRDFNQDKDVIKVEFKLGPKPKKDVTKITLILRPNQSLSPDPYQWSIALERVDSKSTTYVMVKIASPPDAPVGVWSCLVKTNIKGAPKVFVPFQASDFYMLFNPWSKEDSVYMENEDERNEYVLNEAGLLWLGTWRKPVEKQWIFGQFDDIVLRTAVFLLEKSGLVPEERGNPVFVSRAISAIINADDDNGLLVAKWDGNYSDGTPPNAWTGSKAILEQYYNSGGAPVRYGLCWVFSAVAVTIFRALGIPCRSTTIYISAQGSNNIIRNYDAFGNRIEDDQSRESLWNFHAWNEVWMARPDIPERQFGGWQVVDATPLTRSEGIMQCGPAPVEAVRQKNTGYMYDTDFVYAKLNASVRNLMIDEENEVGEYLLPGNSYQAGKRIVTKALNSFSIEDITSQYKSATQPDNNVSKEVVFELVLDSVPLGETFNLTIRVNNKDNTPREIRYVLVASSAYYTGTIASEIARVDANITIQAGEAKNLPPLTIPASTYVPKLVDDGLIKFYVYGEVIETGQRWAEEDDFIFTRPVMTINLPKFYYKVGEIVDISFSFRNPLTVPLTNCVYMVEGPGDTITRTNKHKDVLPLDEVIVPVTFTVGWRTGQKRVIVNFTSRELAQVTASEIIKITK